MRYPKVMFDLDGVLANFHKPFTQLCQEISGGATPVISHPSENLYWDFPEKIIPTEVQDQAWEHIKRSDTYWLAADPLPTEAELDRLRRLENKTHLFFVTSRPGRKVEAQTAQWLRDRVGLLNPDVWRSSHKGDMALELGVDYSLEDKAGNAVYISYHCPETYSYLLDYPYNRFDSTVLGSKVKRVASLTEFLDDVEARG